jgi:NAD(P)-dependent dehydrogenase (short-subunit alcohol dehydrogenase family)
MTEDLFGGGRVAIVTGIGPGMGRSIALGFASRGVDVALGARRKERLEAVADEIRALGREPLVVPTDISDRDACFDLVSATVERFGGVDYLVQNGHHEGDWVRVLDADPDSWRNIFEINFFGSLHLVQAAVPRMQQRGGGAVVLVNSGAAVRNPPTMGAYSTSKAAMATLVRTLALEVGSSNVRVNGVFLGPVEGENLFRRVGEGDALEQFVDAKSKELPLGSIPTPDACAGSVLFLCSNLAAAVTGQHLSVNGGQWTT